ncbi:hypothetical protein [Gelidibacter mesophilus]|uniref:hypothetical protein n=1 Tax=Gelidibacter mesophilus TaxID=169050 RepID=UPI0003F4F7A0|nr:hypothetical protein [Gelidibacter mesophilus]
MVYSNDLGVFEHQITIGNPESYGFASYDQEAQFYTFSGMQAELLATSDQFHYLYKAIKGNFILRAMSGLKITDLVQTLSLGGV